MTITDAIEILDSTALITPTSACEICAMVGVDFSEGWIKRWEMQQGEEVAFYRAHGFIAHSYGPGEGVDCLQLSYTIADALGLRDEQGHLPGHRFTGESYQARANSQAIAQELSRRGIA